MSNMNNTIDRLNMFNKKLREQVEELEKAFNTMCNHYNRELNKLSIRILVLEQEKEDMEFYSKDKNPKEVRDSNKERIKRISDSIDLSRKLK